MKESFLLVDLTVSLKHESSFEVSIVGYAKVLVFMVRDWLRVGSEGSLLG